MADNIIVKDGTAVNRNIAADEIGTGLWVQRFKPVYGPDGSQTDVSDTTPLPIKEMDVSTFRRVTTASTNAVNIKASAGVLVTIHITNFTDNVVYVKFHNTAGTPTAGSGVVFAVGCQAGMIRDVYIGRAFATGIGMTVVASPQDAVGGNVLADAIIEVGYV